MLVDLADQIWSVDSIPRCLRGDDPDLRVRDKEIVAGAFETEECCDDILDDGFGDGDFGAVLGLGIVERYRASILIDGGENAGGFGGEVGYGKADAIA